MRLDGGTWRPVGGAGCVDLPPGLEVEARAGQRRAFEFVPDGVDAIEVRLPDPAELSAFDICLVDDRGVPIIEARIETNHRRGISPDPQGCASVSLDGSFPHLQVLAIGHAGWHWMDDRSWQRARWNDTTLVLQLPRTRVYEVVCELDGAACPDETRLHTWPTVSGCGRWKDGGAVECHAVPGDTLEARVYTPEALHRVWVFGESDHLAIHMETPERKVCFYYETAEGRSAGVYEALALGSDGSVLGEGAGHQELDEWSGEVETHTRVVIPLAHPGEVSHCIVNGHQTECSAVDWAADCTARVTAR